MFQLDIMLCILGLGFGECFEILKQVDQAGVEDEFAAELAETQVRETFEAAVLDETEQMVEVDGIMRDMRVPRWP